ncbi:holin [Enterococcus hirae]|nr:holin [Enterococcus hirae]
MIIDNLMLFTEFKNLINNVYIHVFMLILVADFITGFCRYLGKKKMDKKRIWKETVKYLLVITLVLVAYPYLKITGFEVVGIALVFSYCGVYGLSVIENLRKLGVPVPEFIKNRLKRLTDYSEEQGKCKK